MMTQAEQAKKQNNPGQPNVVEMFGYKDGKLELTLTINGVEVDPLWYFERLDKDLDRMIHEKGTELVKQKLDKLDDILGEVRRNIKEALHNMFPGFTALRE